jgi:hypothetical protein
MKKSLAIGFMLAGCLHLPAQEKSWEEPADKGIRTIMDSLKQHHPQQAALLLRLPLNIRGKDGSRAEFQGFYPDGIPHYYQSFNLDAARTVSTSKLWTGGGLGLNLSGEDMIIGEWDGGKARLTHREFDGRAFQIDGAPESSNHATHVGITLIGKGVSGTAKGMAYKAVLHAYDWNSDVVEMTQAAQNGLLISNHSYGNITGWYKNTSRDRWEWYGDTTISPNEDWKFGFYSSQSRSWDNIAYANPGYLIVKSAGNDRNMQISGSSYHYIWDNSLGDWKRSSVKRNPSGPYDCLTGAGVSKNVLTVGAVEAIPGGYQHASQVVMSSFSSWGPTDDGRIKPDIVGNGVGVYSGTAEGDDTYATYNGTSMASPNVAGSLLLIQEHYYNLNEKYLLAASLKALVIHTADEAGDAPGPDYSFGWGLLNSAKAVEMISNQQENHKILENELANTDSFELVLYADGSEPLKATIAWMDKAATVSPSALNPETIKLINDLDLRIERINNGAISEPWVMDPSNPAAPAFRGDNIRDNVEQVFVSNPERGFYKIKVSHKGILSDGAAQKYTLLISGEAPGLQADFTLPAKACLHTPFRILPVVLGRPDSYEWTINGKTYTDSVPELVLDSLGLYDVKLKVSNPATSDSITKISFIEVFELPQVSMNPVSGTFCSNDDNAVSLSSTPAGALYTGPGTNGSSWVPRNAGTGLHTLYAVYTDQNGCINLDSSIVEVKAAPPRPLIMPEEGDLVSSAPSGNQWFFGGNALDGDTLQRITPRKTGYYIVEIRNNDNCYSRSAVYDHIMKSVTLPGTIGKIYPNPAKDHFILEFSKEEEEAEVRITDAKGALAGSYREYNTRKMQVRLDPALNGLLYIQIFCTSGTYSYPLLVVPD